MRTRFIKKVNGSSYLRAASFNLQKLWLNPDKVKCERKPLFKTLYA